MKAASCCSIVKGHARCCSSFSKEASCSSRVGILFESDLVAGMFDLAARKLDILPFSERPSTSTLTTPLYLRKLSICEGDVLVLAEKARSSKKPAITLSICEVDVLGVGCVCRGCC
jgi:hypothetical protein